MKWVVKPKKYSITHKRALKLPWPKLHVNKLNDCYQVLVRCVLVPGMKEKKQMSELNPNNPIVQQARAHWHKIAALIMVKLDRKQILITQEDLDKFSQGNINIVLDGRKEHCPAGGLIIRIVDDATAAKLAAKEGGAAKDS